MYGKVLLPFSRRIEVPNVSKLGTVLRLFLTTIMSSDTHPTYSDKGMPFRRLGPSGLRVPLFSLGGCTYVHENRGRARHSQIFSDRADDWRFGNWGPSQGPAVSFSIQICADLQMPRAGHHQDRVREWDQHVRHCRGLLEREFGKRDVSRLAVTSSPP